MIAGVDEAGRGPFIGPLVMAAIVVQDINDLPDNIKDSKQLTVTKREELYHQLILLRHEIRVVQPPEIDFWVVKNGLNKLEAKITVDLLKKLNPAKAYIDCPQKNTLSYKMLLSSHLPNTELVVENKADENYLVVAAASILAKVTRDKLISDLHKKVGDFGSGYLTDPKTQSFLSKLDLSADYIRKSWKTYRQLMNNKSQRTL